jgi:hypothetical protein
MKHAADFFTESVGGQLFRKHGTVLGLKCYLFLTTSQGEVLIHTRLYEHAVRGNIVAVCA